MPLPQREASFGMVFSEHPRRVFGAAELSDGMLRYVAVIGALLALSLPAVIAFNEPEAACTCNKGTGNLFQRLT